VKNSPIAALILLLTCMSCNVGDLDFSNIEKPTLEPTVAIPLGSLSYTMRELIEKVGDSQLDLQEDSSSLIHLAYYDTASFNSGEEIITINDVLNSEKIFVDKTEESSESQVVGIKENFTFKYPAENNEQIDSIFYKAGEMVLTVTSFLAHDLTYDIQIANTRKVSDNSFVTFSGELAANSSKSSSVDLVGYKTLLSFSEENGNVFGLDADISIFVGPNEGIPENDSIDITLRYQNQEFSLIYGKFGQDTLNVGGETLDVKFFSDLGESGLRFGSPEINFNFTSSFGLPLGILFNGMYGVDSTENGIDTVYLSGDAATIPQIIGGASTPGDAISSTVSLSPSNSSIRDLLGVSPNTIGFNLTSITNPEDPTQSNFVIDTSKISTTIEMKLPMELSLDDLTQEVGFDLGEGLEFEAADSVSLRIVADNGFPFSASVKLSIVDENDSTLFSVPSVLVLEAPFLNLQGLVTQSRRQVSDVPINKSGVEALAVGSRLKLILTLNTPSSNREIFVKILADYRLDVKVSAVGKLSIDL